MQDKETVLYFVLFCLLVKFTVCIQNSSFLGSLPKKDGILLAESVSTEG